MTRVAIVGGGIVGLATALEVVRLRPAARPTVFEKESAVGQHQSGHNSGVLHCGLSYRPGSLKARLAVDGIRRMVAFCREHEIAHEICGKLVVASSAAELDRLAELQDRGEKNGLLGLRRLSPEQIRQREPHVAGVAALLVPEEGIVDYPAVCRAFAAGVGASSGTVITGARIVAATRRQSEWILRAADGREWAFDRLINCAGLHSDRVAMAAGRSRPIRIVPFRGEYWSLRAERRHLVRHLVYPVPDPAFPFLGVHFTRSIDGRIEAGPNAVLAFAREGYRRTDFDASDLFDALSYPGLWRFLIRYPRMALTELGQSLSKDRFCAALQRLVPEIRPDDLEPGGSGVRAQAMAADGSLVQDFELVAGDGELHVLNAPSPGATASLAIGEEIARRMFA